LNGKGIHTLKHDLCQQIDSCVLNNDKIFCTERYIENIIKPSVSLLNNPIKI